MKLRLIIILFSVLAFPSISLADEKRYDVPVGNSPAYGPSNAPVTLIEFIDFQ